MSEHYYTSRPTASHDHGSFTANLRGMEFEFVTDAAVFSRQRIDFGSALLIEAMQIRPDETVLDLGCGYGPIGMTAARLAPQGRIYMVDVNERAVELARTNLARNGIANAEVRAGFALEPVAGLTFTTVLTNPPIRAGKQVIYQMISNAHQQLAPGGSIWVVIQTKQGAPSMKKHLEQIFGNVADVDRKAGYHIFRATKRVATSL